MHRFWSVLTAVLCAAGSVNLAWAQTPSDADETASRLIAYCDAALEAGQLGTVVSMSQGVLVDFDFPIEDRGISGADQMVQLPEADGISLWLSQRDELPVCVLGGLNHNRGLIRSVEQTLQSRGRAIAHSSVNVQFGVFGSRNAIRVVEFPRQE